MKNKEVFKERKQKLDTLIAEAGYKSFRAFSKDVDITAANLYSNLDTTYDISIKRMFKIAQVLNVPILQIIDVFYPDELAENQSLF